MYLGHIRLRSGERRGEPEADDLLWLRSLPGHSRFTAQRSALTGIGTVMIASLFRSFYKPLEGWHKQVTLRDLSTSIVQFLRGELVVLLITNGYSPISDSTRKRYLVIASLANLSLRGNLCAIVVKVRLHNTWGSTQ